MPPYEELRTRHADQFRALLPAHIDRLSWSADRIAGERERGLRALLRVAKERSPWHRERLGHVDPDRVTESDLASIPPMTKDDMMTNFDDVVTDRRLTRDAVETHLDRLTTGGYLHDEYVVVASGGSSGTRGVFVYDWEGWLACALSSLRFRTKALGRTGLGRDATRAVIAGGKASHMSYAMTRTFVIASAASQSIPASLPLEEIASRINEIQPTIVGGHPTVISALAREALAGRVRIAPRMITCASEPLLEDMRAVMGEAWGSDVAIINQYFTSEGPSASACGQGRGMHLSEDVCIFEPVDESGRAVAPGERAAKLYITQLFNYAQPLIRYELTDEVTLLDEGPCACGSQMRRIDDIGGRSDDVFTYPGGVVHPMAFRSPLGRERHIIEYQVHQTAGGADVVLRTDGAVDTDALRVSLATSLDAAGVRDAQVRISVQDSEFERQSTGKFKRFFPLFRS